MARYARRGILFFSSFLYTARQGHLQVDGRGGGGGAWYASCGLRGLLWRRDMWRVGMGVLWWCWVIGGTGMEGVVVVHVEC